MKSGRPSRGCAQNSKAPAKTGGPAGALLRFESQDAFIQIDLASQERTESPARGDARLSVRVSSGGFAGQTDTWVLEDRLRRFCAALAALERDRQGEAALSSCSPGELDLRLHSIDCRGHMAVEGSVGIHVRRGNWRHWHAVHFGFEFDPSQPAKAVSTEWVKRNAAPPADTEPAKQQTGHKS